MFSARLETGKAWTYKEIFRDLWHHETAAKAKAFLKWCNSTVIHTGLEPLKKDARTIRKRIDNIVSYYTIDGISTGVAEGINSKQQSIKRKVGGYRNRQNYKRDLLRPRRTPARPIAIREGSILRGAFQDGT